MSRSARASRGGVPPAFDARLGMGARTGAPPTSGARTEVDMVADVTRAKSDRDYPDRLPEHYKRLWPDLATWPDAGWIHEFARRTKKDSDARLAILTGLRRYASVDLGTAWAGLAAYLAVVLGLVSAAAGIAGGLSNAWAWTAWIPSVVVSVVYAVFLLRLMDFTGEADERRRSAIAWLAAIEDEIRRAR